MWELAARLTGRDLEHRLRAQAKFEATRRAQFQVQERYVCSITQQRPPFTSAPRSLPSHAARYSQGARTGVALNRFFCYRAAIGDCPSFPRNEALFKQLIEIFVLEKTRYEICYGAANRSGHIPQARVVKIIGHGK